MNRLKLIVSANLLVIIDGIPYLGLWLPSPFHSMPGIRASTCGFYDSLESHNECLRNGFHVARTCFQYEVSTTNPAVLYRNPTVNIYVVLQMTDLHLTTFCWSPNHISYDRKPEHRKVAVLEAHKKTKNQHKIFLIKTKR